MPRKSVFDSTEAVIGVLWDITLSFLVARVAFFYAVLAVAAVFASFAALTIGHAAGHAVLPAVFSSAQSRRLAAVNTLFREIRGKGAASGTAYVGEPALIHPTATAHVSTVSSGPAMTAVLVACTVLSVAACCRLLMDYARIPRHRGFRLAIGAVGAVYVAAAWLVTHLVVAYSHAHETRGRVPLLDGRTVGAVGAALVASVAAMPWLSMQVLEQRRRRGGSRNSTAATSSKTSSRNSRNSRSSRSSRNNKHRRAVDSIDRVSSTSVSSSESESEDELAAAGEKPKTASSRTKSGNGRLLREKSTKKRYDLRRNPKQTAKVDLI